MTGFATATPRPGGASALGSPLAALPVDAGEFWREPWVPWAAGVLIGVPLLTILLGEAADRVDRSTPGPSSAGGGVLRGLRTLVLPAAAQWVFVTRLAGYDPETNASGYPPDSLPAKLSVSLLLASALFVGLGAVNALLFTAADRATWRSRVPRLFLDLSRAFLVLIGAAGIASVVWGANLGGIVTALGVGSIVIGLALQDTLGNLMSGIAILFERPFSPGEWVRVGDGGPEGKVLEMNWRSVRLQTREGDLLVVPNLSLAGETLRCFDKPRRAHMERLSLGFSYSDAPGDVKAAALRVAARTPGVLADPEPTCFTVGYGDSSVNYELRIWTLGYDCVPRVREAVFTGIWYEHRRAGLTIPFPIRTTLNYHGPTADAEDRPPATAHDLRAAEAFRTASDAALEELAAASVRVRFAAGETVVAPGEPCRSLFVVLAGEIELWAPRRKARPGDEGVSLGVLGRGEVFGSIGLLPNSESPPGARAAGEAEALRAPSAAVRGILDGNRPLARELTALMEARRDAARRAARAARKIPSRNGSAAEEPRPSGSRL